jgi:fructose-1,6-bisphosphatase
MKIVFEFNDDEQDLAEMAFKGKDYALAASDFDTWLRNKWKYSDLTDEENKLIEEVREQFYDSFGKLLDY